MDTLKHKYVWANAILKSNKLNFMPADLSEIAKYLVWVFFNASKFRFEALNPGAFESTFRRENFTPKED